jgi:hypothetical protein
MAPRIARPAIRGARRYDVQGQEAAMSTISPAGSAGHAAGNENERLDDAPVNRSPAALRALAEAAERRRLSDAAAAERPAEIGGRAGPDPVRYGDWEKGGICWDF